MRGPSCLVFVPSLLIISGLLRACHASEVAGSDLSQTDGERRRVGGLLWRRQDYKDYVTKGMREVVSIRRELLLSEAKFRRATELLRAGIVHKTLLENSQQADSLFSIEKSSRRVVIVGPAEQVVSVQTMIEDELTFLFAVREEACENTLVILSLVDPVFFEKKPLLALEIAEDSYEGVRRILKVQEQSYRRAKRRVWFNYEIGTVTVFDRPENIRNVREYLALRPYAPRVRTY